MSTKNANMIKAQRREAARAEALALQQKQAARDKRSRMIAFAALGAGLIVVAAVVFFILRQDEGSPDTNFEDKPLSQVEMPSTAQETGGIPVGAGGAAGTTNEGAPVVDIYLDYMCPICGQFEAANAASIDQMTADGTATVVYHPVSILDRQSQGSQYSTRSAAAVAWVADQAPEAFPAFSAALFTNQPAEGTEGLTNAQLASFAEEAGVPADVAAGIEDGTALKTFGQYVFSATNAATEAADGNFGTPRVLIDGEEFPNWNQPGALQQAVEAAAAAG